MDILKHLNDGVKTIEQNLCGEMDLDRAAKVACMSKDSFLRFFSYMAGMSVAQYVRRRRLTLAAMELRRSETTVLEIAVKYGYESADSFTRAFTRQHGATPQAARSEDVPLKLYQPISFAIAVKGAKEMDFRLVDVEPTPAADFLRNLGGSGEGEAKIARLWATAPHNKNRVRKTAWYSVWRDGGEVSRKDNGTVWYGYWKNGEYTILPTDGRQRELNELSLPKGRYAVLGMEPGGVAWEEVPGLREQVLQGWLPCSGYTLGDGPVMEIHQLWTDWEQTKKARYYEIWVPVKEAEKKMIEKKPLISVLIPVYQAEEYLARCLDSVLAQTYPNMEILMVDDGSTDGGAAIGKEYAKAPNIRYVFTEHQGVSHARQVLVEQARGEYFFFLDSDDYIDSKTLEILYDLSVKYNADVAQCSMQKWTVPEKSVDYGVEQVQVYGKEGLITRYCCGGAGLLRCMLAAKLYRRNVFRDVTFPVGKIHEDEFAMHHILGNCETVVCTSLELYHYFYNPSSLTKKTFSYQRYDALYAIQDRIDFCRERGLDFAADMVCLHYALLCLELYRNTVAEYGEADPHLTELLEKYREKAQYLLSTGRLDPSLREQVEGWMTAPLSGDVPRYYHHCSAYYDAWEKEQGRE